MLISKTTLQTSIITGLLLISILSNGQNKAEAEKLVNEGVAEHDKRNYTLAIAKYDEALKVDANNLYAFTEKALTLSTIKRFDEAIAYCKEAIDKHPDAQGLRTIYVTYGNSLDALEQTKKALDIYNKGIAQFPDYYQLHFNKAITLVQEKKYEEAIPSLEESITLNPAHASSHHALGRLLDVGDKRIPCILALSRFLTLETNSSRASENLQLIWKIMGGAVEKTGNKSVTISISPSMLSTQKKKGKKSENDFSSVDLLVAMSAGLDYDDKYKDESDVQRFIRKFTSVCSILSEIKDDNSGFYWEYYAPYFIEMKEKNFIETFSNIAFASTKDELALEWLKNHSTDATQFESWSKTFSWAK
jgi:tetratricopeptide (TPR) repeat protein